MINQNLLESQFNPFIRTFYQDFRSLQKKASNRCQPSDKVIELVFKALIPYFLDYKFFYEKLYGSITPFKFSAFMHGYLAAIGDQGTLSEILNRELRKLMNIYEQNESTDCLVYKVIKKIVSLYNEIATFPNKYEPIVAPGHWCHRWFR